MTKSSCSMQRVLPIVIEVCSNWALDLRFCSHLASPDMRSIFVILHVPQQENLVDCGLFSLQYLEHYLSKPFIKIDQRKKSLTIEDLLKVGRANGGKWPGAICCYVLRRLVCCWEV
jgi:Ulp1 family protease